MNLYKTALQLFGLSLFLWAIPYSSYAQTLSKEHQIEDLLFLKEALKRNHPNLYTYSSSQELEAAFAHLIAESQDSLSLPDMYRRITSLSDIVKDGHTYIYPSEAHLNTFYENGHLLPIEVKSSEDRFWIVDDLSGNHNLLIGAELLSINGVSTEELIELATDHLPRDGNNLNYPKHLISEFLPAYFSFFYGFFEQYTVRFKDLKGNTKTLELAGMTRTEQIQSRQSKSSARESVASERRGIRLQKFHSQDLAVLIIPSFDHSTLKKDYQQKFKSEIRNLFEEIEAAGIQHLAIDLRNNQGGALSNGVFLLRHIMEDPFQCVNSYYQVSKKQGYSLKKMNNRWDGTFQPLKNHYKGKVCLLVNGGSFSCSAIVARTFQQYQRGIMIGEMTGGSGFVNSGGPTEHLVLPHSKILVHIPQTQYRLTSDPSVLGKGVVPEHIIGPTSADIRSDKDPFLQFLLETIR